MDSVKTQVLDRAIDKALDLECNALLGISFFPYVVNGSMMGVSVTGTAARVEKSIN